MTSPVKNDALTKPEGKPGERHRNKADSSNAGKNDIGNINAPKNDDDNVNDASNDANNINAPKKDAVKNDAANIDVANNDVANNDVAKNDTLTSSETIPGEHKREGDARKSGPGGIWLWARYTL